MVSQVKLGAMRSSSKISYTTHSAMDIEAKQACSGPVRPLVARLSLREKLRVAPVLLCLGRCKSRLKLCPL